MKKEYLKPICDVVAFEVKEVLMDDESEFGGFETSGEGVEPW